MNKTWVVVTVEDGCVTGVYCTQPDVKVVIADYDTLNEEVMPYMMWLGTAEEFEGIDPAVKRFIVERD